MDGAYVFDFVFRSEGLMGSPVIHYQLWVRGLDQSRPISGIGRQDRKINRFPIEKRRVCEFPIERGASNLDSDPLGGGGVRALTPQHAIRITKSRTKLPTVGSPFVFFHEHATARTGGWFGRWPASPPGGTFRKVGSPRNSSSESHVATPPHAIRITK